MSDLVCRDCGRAFVFDDRPRFEELGLSHEPSRCPECRGKRKARMAEGLGKAGRRRKEYRVHCPECGKWGTVPFKPRGRKRLVCEACWLARKKADGGPASPNRTDE